MHYAVIYSGPYRLLNLRVRLRNHVVLAQTSRHRAADIEPSGSVVRGRLHEMRVLAFHGRSDVHAVRT